MTAAQPPTPLETTLAEIERHADAAGWDHPPQLFALVDTAELLSSQPQLAAHVGLDPADVPAGLYTPVEQEPLPDGPLDEALGHIMWPEGVIGCALVHEVLVLPPQAEADRPEDADPQEYAHAHPQRREVRLAVAVLSDGSSASALRLRANGAADGPDDLLLGTDLAPNLTAALLATLR